MAHTNFATIEKPKLQERIDSYFRKNKEVHSMTGLALYLGVTRKTLANYAKTDRFGHMIEMAKLRCENLLEERLIQGVPATGTIFILKNNYGWVDKTEVDQTIKGSVSLSALFDKAKKKKEEVLLAKPEEIEGEVVHDEPLPDKLF